MIARVAMLAACVLVAVLPACTPSALSASEYGAGLTACSTAAKLRQEQGRITLEQACQESIACENELRARAARPPRDASAGCK